MAHPKGFEPLTPRFVVWCSIQLSYGCLPVCRDCCGDGRLIIGRITKSKHLLGKKCAYLKFSCQSPHFQGFPPCFRTWKTNL